MGKRVSERATRGGEGRNTAVSGHRIHVVRLGKPLEPAVPETTCDFYPNNPNNPSKVAIIRPKTAESRG